MAPTSTDKQRLLVRAAVMYYVEGLTQLDIARHLGVSRATAGRLVAQARATGVVRIEVVSALARQVEVERELERRYDLEEAVVVDPADSDAEGAVDLGHGCADLLSRKLRPGTVLGLGWGSNPREWIARTAEVLGVLHRGDGGVPDVTVVQLAGSSPGDPTRPDPSQSVAAVAQALGAHQLLIASPLYVADTSTAASLRADRGIATALATIARADVCMFGVGHVSATTPLHVNGYLDESHLEALRSAGAVGDVVGRFFDAGGVPVGGELADRTLSAELDVLRSRPLRVAVAAGAERVAPLRAALESGLANAVVTDTTTALTLAQTPSGSTAG